MPADRVRASAFAPSQPEARVVIVPADRIAMTEPSAPQGVDVLVASRIHVIGEDVSRLAFLLAAQFEGSEADRTQIAVAGPSSLSARSEASRAGLSIADVNIGVVPSWCDRIRLLWMQISRHRRVYGILDSIESSARGLDYMDDAEGSERLADGVLERIELLRQTSDVPQLLTAAFSLDRHRSSLNQFVALLADAQARAPDLWIRDGSIYAGPSLEGAAEYQTGTSLLLRVGPADALAHVETPPRRPRAIASSSPAYPVAPLDEARQRRAAELRQRFGSIDDDLDNIVTPVMVELSDSLSPVVSGTHDGFNLPFRELIEAIREEGRYTVGIKFPGIRFRPNPNLSPSSYVIQINEITIDDGHAYPDRRWCRHSESALTRLGVDPIECIDPRTGTEACWLTAEDAAKAESAGFRANDTGSYILDHLAVTLWNHASLLTTIDTVAELLSSSQSLLTTVRSAAGGLPGFTSVLGALLQERVPVREWQVLTNRYLELTDAGLVAGDIVEELRVAPAIRPSLPGNTAETPVYLLTPSLVEVVRRAVVREGPAAALALSPEAWAIAIRQVQARLSAYSGSRLPVVVVDDAELRPFVRALLASEFPHLPVLSRREMLFPQRLTSAELLTDDE